MDRVDIEKRNKQVDQLFTEWDRWDTPGAAIAIIRDGEVVYKRGYGAANLEYGIPITPATVFHVASVSKQFTAFAIALLEAEGALSADDEVRKYVPEVPEFSHPVTIRHLAHHTSGLRDQWEMLAIAGWRLDDVITTEQILKMVSKQRELNFGPGTEHVYCNTGYTLMAETVSRITGRPFPDWMKEKVFKPLGMSHTHFHDDHERIVSNRAYSYYRGGENDRLKKSVLSYANVGATSLFTTVEDLVRWIKNLRSGTVGGRESIDRLMTRGVLNDGTEIDYAFGIAHTDQRGLHGIGHAGGDAGFRTWLQYYPDQDFGVVVLSNLASFAPSAMALKITEIFLGEYMQDEDHIEPQPHIMKPAALRRFVGGFQVLDTPVIATFNLAGGQLHVHSNDLPATVLTPVSDTEFVAGASGNRVAFEVDADGNVTGFTSTLDGQEYRGVPLDEVPVEELGQYEGRYYSPELQTFYSMQLNDEGLRVIHQRHVDVKLTPLEHDQFGGDQWWFGRISFARNDSNEIVGFRLTGGRVRNLRFDRVVE